MYNQIRYPSDLGVGTLLEQDSVEQAKKILTKVLSPVYFGFVVIRDNS